MIKYILKQLSAYLPYNLFKVRIELINKYSSINYVPNTSLELLV